MSNLMGVECCKEARREASELRQYAKERTDHYW